MPAVSARQRLLQTRLCDLRLSVERSDVAPMIRQLHREMRAKGIRFQPHTWFSNEWFTPDHVPGIAIPFYLARTDLRDLERSQMLDVEGGTPDWCLRILRHEAGHTIDNAYRLYQRKTYHKTFGPPRPYPKWYRPRSASRDFVLNLDLWYAQSHPAEDFAETFAVWLNPKSQWHRQYQDWNAIHKLDYIDSLINRIGPAIPAVMSRKQPHPLSEFKMTLQEHYDLKRATYLRTWPRIPDRDLLRLFSPDKKHAHRPIAAPVLKRIRPTARALVSRWTGEAQLTIDQTLADMITRAELMNLHLTRSIPQTRLDLQLMLAAHTMNYLTDRGHRVLL